MKSFTDLEQSHKLAKILPLESADMHYYNNRLAVGYYKNDQEYYDKTLDRYIPAWSLAALRNLLSPAIKPNKDSYLFLFESHNTFDKSWVYRYYNEDDTSYLYYKNTNEVDACVAMIEKLHELKML